MDFRFVQKLQESAASCPPLRLRSGQALRKPRRVGQPVLGCAGKTQGWASPRCGLLELL